MVNGEEGTKEYAFESTGSGVALIDYDGDGYPDIFLVNGSRLEGFAPSVAPTNHLFHNNRDGTFTDVTSRAGVGSSGWGQGVCAGDFDNDGFDDLFVTYYGRQNILYHNNGDGTFTDATAKAGFAEPSHNWSTGCAFVDYDRDGRLDLFVASYVDFNPATAELPGSGPNCLSRGVAVFCGPRGLPAARSYLYRNQGNGKFADVSAPAGIRSADPNSAVSRRSRPIVRSRSARVRARCPGPPALHCVFARILLKARTRSTPRGVACNRAWGLRS